MSRKQNRFSRYLLLGFVALAYILHPFFVNQIPPLASLLKDVPPIVVFIGALVFAVIVVVGPELLNEKEVTSEQLWREFWQENQRIINERLKSSLDQNRHIAIHSIPSPEDLAFRGEAPHSAVGECRDEEW